jgi:Ca-activated chloride channel family protein
MKLLIFIFLMITNLTHPLSYDSAIYKAQKGNWQDAHSALSSIITDNPDRADVMYDAGVAAYNLGNKCQAATCFARAAECSNDKHIAFCAHFNAGNTYVDEKKLEIALAEYDKALAIEPDNEYAHHNRDRVAQMLQEQQQKEKQEDQQQSQDDKQDQDEQQDKDKQDQNKDDGQDQKNQEQNQDGNDSQSSNGNNKKDGKQNQNGNDKQEQNDSSQDESLDKQSQGDSDQRDAADKSKDAQRQKHGKDKKEQHQNSADDKKRNDKNKFDKQSQDAQKEGNEQQSDKHEKTPGQQNIGDDKDNLSAQEGQEQAISDPWLLRILNDQEVHDKAVNKQLMEAKIRQQGGKNGQNCW